MTSTATPAPRSSSPIAATPANDAGAPPGASIPRAATAASDARVPASSQWAARALCWAAASVGGALGPLLVYLGGGGGRVVDEEPGSQKAFLRCFASLSCILSVSHLRRSRAPRRFRVSMAVSDEGTD